MSLLPWVLRRFRSLRSGVSPGGIFSRGHLLGLGMNNPGDEQQGGAEGRQPNKQQWERRKTIWMRSG